MRKYLSLIGVLLVLVVFHLGPNAEAQVVELDSGLLYASPALLLGINFDYSGDNGLETYPSLSTQVTAGIISMTSILLQWWGLLLVTSGIRDIQTTSTLPSKVACFL